MDKDPSKTIYARRIPVLGQVRQKEGAYYVEEHTVCNQAVGFLCPGCNKPIVVKPMVTGRLTAECRHCHTRVAFTVDPPSPLQDATSLPSSSPQNPVFLPSPDIQEEDTPPPSLTPAKLIWGRRSGRHEVFLHEGVNVIGRADSRHSSEIEIDDPLVSVRSVEIMASLTSAGYEYRMKVRRATNPVFINGIVVTKGGVVLLTSGANIKMGATFIKFKITKP